MKPKELSGKNPLFILWTGDAGARRFGKFSEEIIEWEMNNITTELASLKKLFGGKVPIYPVIGNHDSYPQHQFPAKNYWVYEVAARLWKQFLPEDAVTTLKEGGYYALTITKGLRLIVLNTVIYYHQNEKIPTTEKDPGGQIAWMRKELAEAEKNGQVVYIASHIPPGSTSDPMHTEFVKPFLDGMKGYHHIIRGSFWGHLHKDTWQLLGDTSSGSTDYHVAHLASTLGTKTGKNPSFRRYIFDDSKTFQIDDWTTFYMDLPADNKAKKITWKELYSAKSAFGISNASPSQMHSLTTKLKTDNALFEKAYKHQTAGAPRGSCNAACRKEYVCLIFHAYPTEYKKCIA